jgi:DNA modification methylase
MGKNARTFGQDLMRGEGRQKNGLTWTGAAVATENTLASTEASGTSIFDPVLCELVYRWFCPAGGAVLDPFAGGSVRGIVASKLGLSYTGIDLSERQIEANRKQAADICSSNPPTWILGDSRSVCDLAPGSYDLIFSCPPYGNLEVYSDDERDLSTLDYPDFLKAYRAIIGNGAAMLKPGRFACFVVGDFRDRQGFYRNFVSETIAAFESAGLRLYNEAVLVTAVGSLPIRIGKQFGRYRKLGKTHQNVLVFYNGQPKQIPDTFGECDFGQVEQAEEQDSGGSEQE